MAQSSPVAHSIVSEKIDPAEPPVVMSQKPLTSDIPSPAVVHEDDAELHGVLNDLLSLVAAIAAQVPTAHNLASQAQGLRDRLARAMAASK